MKRIIACRPIENFTHTPPIETQSPHTETCSAKPVRRAGLSEISTNAPLPDGPRKRHRPISVTPGTTSPVSGVHGSVPVFSVSDVANFSMDDLLSESAQRKLAVSAHSSSFFMMTDESNNRFLYTTHLSTNFDTDTEARTDRILRRALGMNRYIMIEELGDEDNRTLIAQIRIPENGRPELMKINAGQHTSGKLALDLVKRTIVKPFGIDYFTLHDAAHVSHGDVEEVSLRMFRALANHKAPSIYEYWGFKLATFLQKPTGKFDGLTQIPELMALARNHVCSTSVEWVVSVFLPTMRAPLFTPTSIDAMTRRLQFWMEVSGRKEIQGVFSSMLSVSQTLGKTETVLIHEHTIDKQSLFKDIELIMQTALSFMTGEHTLWRKLSTHIRALPAEHQQDVLVFQAALDCMYGHFIYECDISGKAETKSLSQRLSHPISREGETFRDTFLRMSGNKLTWDGFCMSADLKACFS